MRAAYLCLLIILFDVHPCTDGSGLSCTVILVERQLVMSVVLINTKLQLGGFISRGHGGPLELSAWV